MWSIAALLIGFAAGLYAGWLCRAERFRSLQWEARLWRNTAEQLRRGLDDEA